MKARIPKKASLHLSAIVEEVIEIIGSESYLQRSRQRQQDFTRKRKMPFCDLMLLLLQQPRCSTQSALRRFFKAKGDFGDYMTQQSFSDARQKIKWEAFHELVERGVSQFYSAQYAWRTWHGYTVFACDGSKTQLPSDPDLLADFGGTGVNADAPTAQASYLYDVLNGIIADARIACVSTSERSLAKQHLAHLGTLPDIQKKLIIFDRGYPSADMIAALDAAGCDFLFRVRGKFNVKLDALPLGVHDFPFTDENSKTHDLTAVKLTLDSGETELLLTSLKDRRMGVKAFKDLYFARWGVETKIGELKHIIEIENFSGRTKLTIFQDFFASVELANMLAVIALEAQPIIDFATDEANKYEYKINKNNAIGVLKDELIAAVCAPSRRARLRHLQHVVNTIAKTKSPVRPGRSVPRTASPRRANFYHNRKSNA
jgi:hypothetical protein